MLVTTHATHCQRRSDEMQEATQMLEEIGSQSRMCQASRDILRTSYRSGVTQHFKHGVPDRFEDVIAFLDEHTEAKSR